MALPCVAVTSLIIPFGQVPSSTSTVAPFLMSNGSFLVMYWALQAPLAAATKIKAASLVISDFMSKALSDLSNQAIAYSKSGYP